MFLRYRPFKHLYLMLVPKPAVPRLPCSGRASPLQKAFVRRPLPALTRAVLREQTELLDRERWGGGVHLYCVGMKPQKPPPKMDVTGIEIFCTG